MILVFYRFIRPILILAGLFITVPTVLAADTTPQALLSQWTAAAGAPGNAERGKVFFNTQHTKDLSCALCHGSQPVSPGKHSSTAKILEPLSPNANPKSLTDNAKVNKWFRRNCNDVLGRECSAQEKADVIAFLLSLKP